MKKIAILLLMLIGFRAAVAQRKQIDSIRRLLKVALSDTARCKYLTILGQLTYNVNPDSSILFGQQLYALATKTDRTADKAEALNIMGNAYSSLGDYAKGIQFYLKAKTLYETIRDVVGEAKEINNIGNDFMIRQDYNQAIPYFYKARTLLLSHPGTRQQATQDQLLNLITINNIGESFLYTHKIDSAEFYFHKSEALNEKIKFELGDDNINRDLGEVETAKGNKKQALNYYYRSISEARQFDDAEELSVVYLSVANLYHKYAQMDSAVYYGQKALNVAKDGGYLQDVLNAGTLLTKLFDEDNNIADAYKYFKITTAAKDSLYNQDKIKQLLSIDFDEKQRQQDIANAQARYQDTVRMYILTGGLILLLFIAFILWRTGKQRQKAYQIVSRQKADLEAALSQLQLTQKQLIQSEKMASLGELTAGIAHEIQNPLNFINNFSEVNIELLSEMKEELKAGQIEDAIGIADDIEQNLSKVIHHGKRADGIVKGMLQHSRSGNTTKELTDINTLADEYLRLAYHGLRAKDKSFNAELITGYAESLPKANILPQEIGRVLLNLYTNAFYAVQQKQKMAGDGYKPTMEVSTSSHGDHIVIKVKDNGMGMPEHIKEKIMQPFFTTKPTGEGTGLGLSMSYDIIVKGHEGEITVDTKENDYTVFTITLPL